MRYQWNCQTHYTVSFGYTMWSQAVKSHCPGAFNQQYTHSSYMVEQRDLISNKPGYESALSLPCHTALESFFVRIQSLNLGQGNKGRA